MKPGTPLPWEVDREIVLWQAGDDELEEVATASRLSACTHDAAYIAHACNAYPKLVEALKRRITTPGANEYAACGKLLQDLGE